MIYFDFAASTPLDEEAAQAYVQAAAEYYGNSSSLHDIGSQAAGLLENCRSELAKMIGIDKNGLFFTSGGSEGNFLAIEALLTSVKKDGKHIIAGMAEHSSIHGALKRLEGHGYEITFIPFTSDGLLDLDRLRAAIKPETVLVTVQHINSEIGTIQPLEKIAGICQEHDLLFHSDFVQSFGKINIKDSAQLVDSFSISGHKFYGPKGVGAAYINPRIGFSPFFPGTTHESGFRPGTVNVPAIAAMTVAAQKISNRLSEEDQKYQLLRRAFMAEMEPIKAWAKIFQAQEPSQLSSIIGLGISGIEGQWLMLECNRSGFSISTGSACQAGMQSPSKTMLALGVSRQEAKEFVRISFGKTSKVEDVHRLGQCIAGIVTKFKTAYASV